MKDDDTRKMSFEQRTAVDMCCDMTQNIVGVTGGAGTGKTFVLGKAHEELASAGVSTILCAPTGRAAKRVQELTGIPALTIHRMLAFPQPDEFDEEQGEPKFGRHNPLPFRCVIVDESSMIGPTLYRQLLNAIPRKGVIRFFGDNNQLPPVEDDKGAPPFIDVLTRYPSQELTFNYRSEDLVVSNAIRILKGRIPLRNDRFEILYADDPVRFMINFVTDAFKESNCQVIMPTRKGKWGTMRTNPSLQLKFNKKGPMLRLDRYAPEEPPLAVRAGDKVLWIKNDYKLELFNGEIGRISWLDNEEGSLSITTPEREVLVPPRLKMFSSWHGTVIDYDPRKQIELGYAVTTHKAQGSEFDHIVYCISRSAPYLLNRRNFYTAVTRARKGVTVIADRRAMSLAMRRWEATV